MNSAFFNDFDEYTTQTRRNPNEYKLTYAEYDGDIPADDDPADYYAPIKAVYVA